MKRKSQLPIVTVALAGAFFLLSLLLGKTPFAAQSSAPPDLGQVAGQLQNAINNLSSGSAAQQGINQLQKIANSKDFKDLNRKAQDAKKKGDDAVKAAEKAKEAAMKAARDCNDKNKKEAESLMAAAQAKITDAQNAKQAMDDAAKNLAKAADDAANSANQQVKDLQAQADKAVDAAKQSGLKESDWSVAGVRSKQNALNQEKSKQEDEGTKENGYKDEGSLHKLDKAHNEMTKKLNDIKSKNDPSDAIGKAQQLLNEAGKYLDDCPPKVGMVAPQTPPTEVAIHVGNDQGSNVCVEPGQDASGLGGQVIGDGPDGTIVNTSGSPQTVERTAKAKGIRLCWVEVNYCTIYTPLTAYRGHQHVDHVAADGRYLHDHEAPDPPLDWGVTPPPTVIRLERK